MKKFRIWILAALAAALCLLCGCSAEDFALPHEVQLAVGQQCALAGELRFTGNLSDITPQDRAEFAQAVTDAVVHIASTDPSVAAVDQDGNVTAVTPGTATVLVSCVDLDFYAEVNINVVEAATPESAALATPETAAQSTPETATPESAEPATPESAATPETATPETATPESAAPATPESAATPETAKTATSESAALATPETAAQSTPETAAPPKMPRATEAPAATREETTAADEKTREPFREFLKKAGSTVANFFGGLFDKSKSTE
ncbi:MAG: Ig-like domain-containing protein [Subdoligranulum sp.]|nr:Ig-like domain-containing protein [Subdoligranulum sp.]